MGFSGSVKTNKAGELVNKLDLSKYTFLDLGCKDGGGIRFMNRFYPNDVGLGVDINERVVAKAREAGHDAIVADAMNLQFSDNQVRFVIMKHFLEHLPSYELTKKCIEATVRVSSKFIYIRQPYFDSNPYLFSKGLKFNFCDWTGHPNHVTLLEFSNILLPLQKQKKISRFAMYGQGLIKDSSHPNIHTILTPIDQFDYDPVKHAHKNGDIKFDEPVYYEVVVVASTAEPEIIEELALKTKPEALLFDSIRLGI